MSKLLRLLIIALLTVAWFADMSLGIGHAAILAPASVAWHTCQPRQILYTGKYRVDNDLFAGMAGKSCIRSATGHDFTVTTNVPGDGPIGSNVAVIGGRLIELHASGGVVSYPSVYIGQNGTSSDPQSGLPVAVIRAHKYLLHITVGGSSPGTDYMQDVDIWLGPSKRSASQHGNAELVIALRGRGAGGQLMSMGGHWYRVSHWTTHVRDANGNPIGNGWPLYLIRAVGTVTSRTIRPATFLWHLRRLGLVSSREWWTSARLGAEIWRGGRGLSGAMTVSS